MAVRNRILALDQGTTGTTCLLLSSKLEVLARAYEEIPQIYPQPGWVSHDPQAIWLSALSTMKKVLRDSDTAPEAIAGLGITNQRETTVMWERATGKPVHDAIVWQCRRSAAIAEGWKSSVPDITERTGLVPDAYFSASKIRWLLDRVEGLEQRCQAGEIAFGTVDSWLLYKLTDGRVHATEPSNACRTMLYHIRDLKWDESLCRSFGIPMAILPAVLPSVGHFGMTSLFGSEIPITGIAGDQQAALFGQACYRPGQLKNTYGTGCFLVMQTGDQPITSRYRLLSSVAWQIGKETNYCLEGSVFSAGSAVQWLRDGLKMISRADETEALARSVTSSEGVVVVPAFSGLGAPYWDPDARGTILGVTRGTRREHIVRATLEAVAFQTRDVVEAMLSDSEQAIPSMRVDGGMTGNDFLMQFQSDVLGIQVERPTQIESTARGAASLAGLGAGLFDGPPAIEALRQVDRRFDPTSTASQRDAMYAVWKLAVKRSLGWAVEA
jgi:glycerol kinase